jgi:mannose-6-phosphate isomerase-like protein (cupin superfamily)
VGLFVRFEESSHPLGGVHRDRTLTLKPGEFCIVPRGVEHKPAAKAMCHVMLFEPATTRNTGNVDHAYTIEADDLERI